MKRDEIALLFKYNAWANARILSACRRLAPEQLHAPAPCSFNNLIGTLTHIYIAERLWRLRTQEGISPGSQEIKLNFPDLDSLTARWQAEEEALLNFTNGLSEAELDRWVEYTTTSGETQGSTLWKILQHLALHSMQFRAEAGTILAALGHSPGDIDLIFYLRETDQR